MLPDTKINKKAKPPKKLSDAIMLALNDLATVEKNRKYKVDMGEWHHYQNENSFYDKDKKKNVCHLCFAGSVMANTCQVPASVSAEFDDNVFIETGWSNIFDALDEIRSGNIKYAIAAFYENEAFPKHVTPEFIQSLESIEEDFMDNGFEYKQNKTKFKNCMLEIAEMLKVNGL